MPHPYDDIFLYLTLLPFSIVACTFRLSFFWTTLLKTVVFAFSSIFCFYGTLIPFFVAQLHVFITRLISYSSVLTRIAIFSFTGGLGSF